MDIKRVQDIVKEDGIVFLTYGGFLSQTLISAMTEALEKEAEVNNLNMGKANNIFTIFIELSQNIMNYSKSKSSEDLTTDGLIVVSRNDDASKYYIDSQNIVSLKDVEYIKPKLLEIQTLDKTQIKQKYKELRRSGKNTHSKGGGIGFYEIAKKCDKIDFTFTKINELRYYFHIRSIINLA